MGWTLIDGIQKKSELSGQRLKKVANDFFFLLIL